MIIHTDTTRFLWEVLENGEYNFLFRDLVVLDVGCNIGAFCIWINELSSAIYAIDIALENVENLKKTVKDSRLDNVKVFHCGISDHNGVDKIEKSQSAGSGGWRLGEAGQEGVEVYTLTKFMENNNINHADILKLDVEGEEFKIIADPTFPYSKISTILGEFHSKDSLQLSDFVNRLKDMGYHYQEMPNSHFIARK